MAKKSQIRSPKKTKNIRRLDECVPTELSSATTGDYVDRTMNSQLR